MLFFRGEEDQQTLRTCDSLTSSSSFRRTQRGKKNEEKHNNNNGSIVFDDVNDDVNKVVFEDVPLPRRALSSSQTFSFVVKRFRTLERSTSKSSLCTFSKYKTLNVCGSLGLYILVEFFKTYKREDLEVFFRETKALLHKRKHRG